MYRTYGAIPVILSSLLWIRWTFSTIIPLLFIACSSVAFVPEDKGTKTQIGTIVTRSKSNGYQLSNIGLIKPEKPILVNLELKKLPYFSQLFYHNKRKRFLGEEATKNNLYTAKFTLPHLDKLKELILQSPEIEIAKRKSFGLINSVTYLFTEKEIEKLNSNKKVYFGKISKKQFNIHFVDSLGSKVTIELKDPILIGYTLRPFCKITRPFGQEYNIKVDRSTCTEDDLRRRKKQIKALLK